MQTKLEKYIDDLSLFEDDMDKYEYIIDIGKRAPSLSQEEKEERYKIQGCQSSVWIIPVKKEGKLFFKTDSDTVIVKGLAFVLADIFSNQTPEEISAFPRERLKELGLEEIISQVRLNGFHSMLNTIYKNASKKEIA